MKTFTVLKQSIHPVSLLRVVEVFLVFILYFAAFFIEIGRLTIHVDEVDWITSSGFYESFVALRIQDPMWVEHRWTLAQPPLTRYIIGLGRTAGGYPISALYIPADYHTPGSVSVFFPPDVAPDVLWWSRFPMVFLAAGSFGILFLLLRRYVGRATAWLFVAFSWGNPYLNSQLARAMSEAPLLFFVTLSLMAAVVLLVSTGKTGPTGTSPAASRNYVAWIWLGALAGLAAGAKLSGIALLGFGGSLACLIFLWSRPWLGFHPRFSMFIRSAGLLVFSALVVFVALNPYLYPDPLNRTVRLFKYRAAEMAWQRTHFAESAMPANMFDRAKIVAARLFADYAPIQFPGAWPLNLALCGFGVFRAILASWKRSRMAGSGEFSTALLLLYVFLALPALLTPLDWNRYYLLPVVLNALFAAIGAAAILAAVWRLPAFLRSRSSHWADIFRF